MSQPHHPQRIFITGASRGIGLEFVRQLAARGDRVFAAARQPDRAKELRALEEHHRDLLTIFGLNVDDQHSIEQAHKAVAAHTDALDILINNAGVYAARVDSSGQPAEKLGDLAFTPALQVLRTNAVAPLLIAQQFLDLLKRGRNPRLISITSGYGSVSGNTGGYPYYYAASKAALNMFMRSFATDPAAGGITTIVMNPGWVKTDMGTPAAPLEPRDSVAGMLRVIDGLSEKDNNRFLDYRGKEIDW